MMNCTLCNTAAGPENRIQAWGSFPLPSHPHGVVLMLCADCLKLVSKRNVAVEKARLLNARVERARLANAS